jgi:uncharacterized protein (TIGR03086 family)
VTDFATRYVTLPDPLGAFDDVYYEVTGLLFAAGQHPEAPDWLLSHVVELCDEYAAVAEGSPEPPPDRGADHVAAFAEAGRRARHAFREEDYLESDHLTPIGILPGSVTVQHVVNELVAHAWDIAHAIGAELHLPDELFDRVQESWQVFFETFGRPELNFEPEQLAPEDASAADRLAAYLGRTV